MYVVMRYNFPILFKELEEGMESVFTGTEPECQDYVDNWVTNLENSRVQMKLIKKVVGEDINNFNYTSSYESFKDMMTKIDEELFKKVIVVTLYEKALNDTGDARLTTPTREFIVKLHKELGIAVEMEDFYRVYEHPYLWNAAVQMYIRWRELRENKK